MLIIISSYFHNLYYSTNVGKNILIYSDFNKLYDFIYE